MAGTDSADPGSGPAASQTAPPPAKDPYDDLLCTICGLTACWKKPPEGPEPAAAPDTADSVSE